MSTNVSFTGVAIKIDEAKKDDESIKIIAGILGYSDDQLSGDIEDIYYEQKKETWQLYQDCEGEVGLIFLIENEIDVFDVDFSVSLELLNEILGELQPDIREHFMSKSAADVKAFAQLYYNGGENPFMF